METFNIIFIYLEIVNLLAFALMGIDKNRARKNRWRIPEATLLLFAFLGGSIGSLGGMYLFHHKTRKPKFSVGVPVILVMQVLFFLAIFYVVSL
jgi:uncharacterized membrane protein YsdA (DUF1294 family)